MSYIGFARHQKKAFPRLIQNASPWVFFLSKLNEVLANYSNAAIQPIGPESFRT
jgi:hypothetical protein